MVTVAELQTAYQRINNLNFSTLTFYGDNLSNYINHCHTFFCQASRMILEIASGIQTFHMPKAPDPAMNMTLADLEMWQRTIDDTRDRLQQVSVVIQSSQFPALQQGMCRFSSFSLSVADVF